MGAPLLPDGIVFEGMAVLLAFIPMSEPPHAQSSNANAHPAHRRCRISGNLGLTGASLRCEGLPGSCLYAQ